MSQEWNINENSQRREEVDPVELEEAISAVRSVFTKHSLEEITERVEELKKHLQGTSNGLNTIAVGVLLSILLSSCPESLQREVFARAILSSLAATLRTYGVLK